ncbi:MAG: hypothetical protein ABJF10_06610, partial [Chthoniobacter sp.]|uniref:hypothetical protein n=1 Tax=Chthoniobacter sp. TaxID=2510640 RepID=UPI0032A27566
FTAGTSLTFCRKDEISGLIAAIPAVGTFMDILSIKGQIVILVVAVAGIVLVTEISKLLVKSADRKIVYLWRFADAVERDLFNHRTILVGYGQLYFLDRRGIHVVVYSRRDRQRIKSVEPPLDQWHDVDWKTTVLKWIGDAHVVVINVTDIADAEWVGWEIVQCARLAEPPVVTLFASLLWLIETSDPAREVRRAIMKHVSEDEADQIMKLLPRPVPYFNDLSVGMTSWLFFRTLRAA